MRDEVIGGIIGAGFSVSGLAVAPNEVLQTISLILTILGAIVSFIIVPVVNWVKEAKQDGKITTEELSAGAKTLDEGIKKTQDAIDEAGKGQSKNG